jgi:aspartate aminotransferase
MLALVEEGDEVVVPTPYWVSFPEQVKLAGARPVFVDTREEDGFALRAAAVEETLTERTRLVVVNSPSNPSGAVMDSAELAALARLAIERGFFLLFDECYAALVYEGAEHLTPLVLGPEAKAVTLICGSCSKSYAMTGWRIGWVAGPRPVIDSLARLQGHSTSNATSISQYAALAALTGDQEPVRRMLATFAARRARVLPRLRALPGVSCVEPRGAFYAFPNIESLLGGDVADSAELAAHLVDACQVVTVPGAAFGREGYLRLSYATSSEILDEALDRLDVVCADLLG